MSMTKLVTIWLKVNNARYKISHIMRTGDYSTAKLLKTQNSSIES